MARLRYWLAVVRWWWREPIMIRFIVAGKYHSPAWKAAHARWLREKP